MWHASEKSFCVKTAHKRLSKNNMLLLSVNCKLTFIKFLSFIIPASVWEVQVQLQFYVHCNFIWIFGLYLHVNHSQHDFYKPLSQVLPQKTSLKSLSEIHFKAALEGLDFKILFNSFFRQTFYHSWNCAPSGILTFVRRCSMRRSCFDFIYRPIFSLHISYAKFFLTLAMQHQII